MTVADLGDIRIHYRLDGDAAGAPLLMLHGLGLDLRLWDSIVPLLPPWLCLVRCDLRGHGLSDAPPPPYAMGALVRDAERLLTHLGLRDAVVLGHALGGMVAQALAVKRLDLVRALVLSNTAARIGAPSVWDDHLRRLRAGGLAAIAEDAMQRRFSRGFRAGPEAAAWRHMLIRTPQDGYEGCAMAMAGTDLLTPTSGLRLPVLGIAGSEDGVTPPDLVRETVALVPGSRMALIRGAGHLPCIEKPEAYASILTQFLKEIGHV